MKQKGTVYRIKFVLSSIGKPVYWLLLLPVLLFVFIPQLFEYILRQTDLVLLKLSQSTAKIDLKKRTKFKKKRAVLFAKYQKLWRRLSKALRLTKAKSKTKPKKKTNKFDKAALKYPYTRRGFFFCLVLILASLLAFSSFEFYNKILKGLPTPNDLINYKSSLTTKIYDRNGVLLYKIYKDQNRSPVTLSQISPFVREATIAIEDKDFYSHRGVSIRGIARSIELALTQGKIQGGSTITQQLVKNTLLNRERTLTRKLREIVLALQVERVMSKNQILEMYLNNVSYGGSVYGIQEAAQRYFHKSANDLDLAESAYLAGLPAAPSTYSPTGPDPSLALDRQHAVLTRMVQDGKISPLEAVSARTEKLMIQPDTTDIKAPHFVMYIKDILTQEYGENILQQGGLNVTTTLDYGLQQQVEKIVAGEVKQLTPLHVGNGAALVTNPKTGEVLAMVGSRNYFDSSQDGQVNVTLRPRQPGSSIKPLMYSAALERGFTPATILDDSPVVYQYRSGPSYAPKNYDGTFHGKEPLRFALANSHNVPAVKTEAAIGLPAFIENARKLGITTWEDTSRFGLSLTLGSGEVLMTDMATAYGVFANSGLRVDLNPLLSVKSSSGETLYQNDCALGSGSCEGVHVMDPGIAYQITSILSDNTARSKAFGPNSVLNIPGQQVAVKTGTTNDLRDNWTFGYTNNRLVATWVGNNDNSPMSNVTSGITGASPIWNKIIRTQLSPDHPNSFAAPNSLEAENICESTGKPPCDAFCQPTYTEYFLPGTKPTAACAPATANAPTTPPPNSLGDTKQASIHTWNTVVSSQ